MRHHLEASVLGSYAPDRYFIEICQRAAEAGATPEPLVFVHEYWHYLQNLTTLHGIKSFAATQQLLAAFSHTMERDGTSRGSSELRPEQQAHIAKFIAWRIDAEGELGPDHDMDVSSDVIALEGNNATFELRWPGTYTRRQESVRLGARAIKESIAHLVESDAARLLGDPPPRTLEFPYSILTRIFKHVVGETGDSPLIVAALGTLALLTHVPALALRPLLERYRVLRSERSTALDALEVLAQEIVIPRLREAVRVLQETDLPSILAMHRGRGTSEKAVSFLVGECQKGSELRLEDPLFDLRPLLQPSPSGEDPIAQLINLMKEGFVPCDMSFDGKVRSFHPLVEDELGLDLPQYLRSFQAQQEFMLMHVRGDGFAASLGLSCPCPFYSVCTHPTRTDHEMHCRVSPWQNHKVDAPGCWFTNGVAATIGPTNIKKLTTP